MSESVNYRTSFVIVDRAFERETKAIQVLFVFVVILRTQT
jgi:hypothetical protein